MLASKREGVSVIIENGNKRITFKSPKASRSKFVLVINNQYTNAANTTQIASGAGKYSTGGTSSEISVSKNKMSSSKNKPMRERQK